MTISDALRADAWSPESDLYLVLLVIDHPDLPDGPIHIVNNKVNITSNGVTYVGLPFEASLPKSPENSPPSAELTINNVGREIGEAIRATASPPSITLSAVRQETPDVVEVFHDGMKLTGVKYNAMTVTGNVVTEDFISEPYPALTYSPAEFPGLIQ